MIMTPKNSTFFSLVWSLVFAVPAIAQQVDYPALSEADTLATSREGHTYDSRVVIDTMAMDMHGVEQMEKMASDTIRNDSALKLIRDGAIRKYALQDLPEAAKYDSLWINAFLSLKLKSSIVFMFFWFYGNSKCNEKTAVLKG